MPAAAKKDLDRTRFYKLVLLMDSPNEFERQRATTQALHACAAADMRFADVVAEVCGKERARVDDLERQLEDARRGGDELADALERYKARIAEYGKAERSRARFCRPCESKRRTIAYLVGLMILAAWLNFYSPRRVPILQTGYGVSLAASPLLYLLIRWRVINFKRNQHWVTWHDNDVFRRLAAWWNEFLGKFVIEE